jgi:hypothetical protein
VCTVQNLTGDNHRHLNYRPRRGYRTKCILHMKSVQIITDGGICNVMLVFEK